MKTILTISTVSLLMSSCASMTTGTNQSLSVHTEPHKEAACELSNDKGSWYIPSTPGSVIVNRAYGDLHIVCKKNVLSGTTKVKSSAKAMTFGNILVGGIIGAAVDAGTGAGYDYPSLIHVPLNNK